jgi:CRP/FNR family transcriptional regulator, cyclic AMP receptor protein
MRLILLPVMHLRSPAEAVRALSSFSPQPLVGLEQRLPLLLGEQGRWLNSWVIACAVYSAARAGLKEQSSTIIKMLGHADPVIRETALWALSKLTPGQHASYSQLMAGTLDEIKQTIQTSLHAGIGGTEMLLTIEKVSILKGVSIFDGIPDDMLAQLAGLLEPEEARTGQTIIQRGELGSEMYIVVTGRLRVHVGDETLAELGERDIFGEMSLLDPGPRSASVTAIGDTNLLKLDRDVLTELMQEHIEVSQAIIRVLTNRLRTAVDLLNQSQGQTKEKGQDIWGDLITNESGLHKRIERAKL